MVASASAEYCKLSRVENSPLSPANSHEIPPAQHLGKQTDPAQVRTYAEKIQYPVGSHAFVTLETDVIEWTDGAQTRCGRHGVPICYHAQAGGYDTGHLFCNHLAILAGKADDPRRLIMEAPAGIPHPSTKLDRGFMVAYDAASTGDLPHYGTAASAAVVADWSSVNMRESAWDSGVDYERGVSDDRQSAAWRESMGW